MRYLITRKYHLPFLTHWFDPENDFDSDLEMIVYDLVEKKYTVDGENWLEILFREIRF